MLGVPVVALFGPGDPRVWAPPGDHVSVVRGSGTSMDTIPVAAAAAALAAVAGLAGDQGSRARTRSQ